MSLKVERIRQKRLLIPLARGVLGGAVGAFVHVLIVINPVTYGSTWAEWLIFGYLVFGLPLGVLIGAIVGIVVGMTCRRTGKNLGPVKRAIIGIIVAMIVSAFIDVVNTPVEYTSRSLLYRLTGLIFFWDDGWWIGRASYRTSDLVAYEGSLTGAFDQGVFNE